MTTIAAILFWLGLAVVLLGFGFLVAQAFKVSPTWGIVTIIPVGTFVYIGKFSERAGVASGFYVVGLVLVITARLLTMLLAGDLSNIHGVQAAYDDGRITAIDARALGYIVQDGRVYKSGDYIPPPIDRSGDDDDGGSGTGSGGGSSTTTTRNLPPLPAPDFSERELEIEAISARLGASRKDWEATRVAALAVAREKRQEEHDQLREQWDPRIDKLRQALAEASPPPPPPPTPSPRPGTTRPGTRPGIRPGTRPGTTRPGTTRPGIPEVPEAPKLEPTMPGLGDIPSADATIDTWSADTAALAQLSEPVQFGPYTIRPPRSLNRRVVKDKTALFGRADASIKIYLKPRKIADGDWPVLLTDTTGRKHLGNRNYANAMKRKYEYGELNGMRFARIGDPPGNRGRREFTYVSCGKEHFIEIKVEYRGTAANSFPVLLASVHTLRQETLEVKPPPTPDPPTTGDNPPGQPTPPPVDPKVAKIAAIELEIEQAEDKYDEGRKAIEQRYREAKAKADADYEKLEQAVVADAARVEELRASIQRDQAEYDKQRRERDRLAKIEAQRQRSIREANRHAAARADQRRRNDRELPGVKLGEEQKVGPFYLQLPVGFTPVSSSRSSSDRKWVSGPEYKGKAEFTVELSGRANRNRSRPFVSVERFSGSVRTGGEPFIIITGGEMSYVRVGAYEFTRVLSPVRDDERRLYYIGYTDNAHVTMEADYTASDRKLEIAVERAMRTFRPPTGAEMDKAGRG